MTHNSFENWSASRERPTAPPAECRYSEDPGTLRDARDAAAVGMCVLALRVALGALIVGMIVLAFLIA